MVWKISKHVCSENTNNVRHPVRDKTIINLVSSIPISPLTANLGERRYRHVTSPCSLAVVPVSTPICYLIFAVFPYSTSYTHKSILGAYIGQETS